MPTIPDPRNEEAPLTQIIQKTEEEAILLFDEADSLFQKRSEVKDSHDRYAEENPTDDIPPINICPKD